MSASTQVTSVTLFAVLSSLARQVPCLRLETAFRHASKAMVDFSALASLFK
jgi:hypothetical protein